MKKPLDALTNPRNIQWIIFAIVVGVIAVIIFMIVFILSPTVQNIFTRARETLLTLLTAGMVLATLILALGTFKIINEERGREERSRKERYLNEIIIWVIQVNKAFIPPSGTGKEALKDWSRNIVTSLSGEGNWVSRNSNIFGFEFNIDIDQLLLEISDFNECLIRIMQSSDISNKKAKEMIRKPLVKILEATDKVLDRALKIRVDQKL